MLETVKNLVIKNSWFSVEEEHVNHYVIFSTRKHGDVANESVGIEDVEEAKRLIKEIKLIAPELKTRLSITDEWTFVQVDI